MLTISHLLQKKIIDDELMDFFKISQRQKKTQKKRNSRKYNIKKSKQRKKIGKNKWSMLHFIENIDQRRLTK